MDHEQGQPEEPMRRVVPELYHRLQSELESIHIHPYDIQANVVKKGNGLEIVLRFGEKFTASRTHFFSDEIIRGQHTPIIKFFQNTAEACQQTLVSDYYKMMKP